MNPQDLTTEQLARMCEMLAEVIEAPDPDDELKGLTVPAVLYAVGARLRDYDLAADLPEQVLVVPESDAEIKPGIVYRIYRFPEKEHPLTVDRLVNVYAAISEAFRDGYTSVLLHTESVDG